MTTYFIYFLLIIMVVMAGALGVFYGKSYHVERLISTTEKWAKADSRTNAAEYELKSMGQIFRLKTQLMAELEKARNAHKGNDFSTEFIADDYEGDQTLPDEIVLQLKSTLPDWSENVAKSLPIRTENATHSLPIRSNEPNAANLAPIVVKEGRVSIKNPNEGDRFFNIYKIEKQPISETLTFYKRSEAGFAPVFDIPIYEIESSKGKPFKPQANYPYVLLCKWEKCKNVIITTAHNAKECGHQDCAKL